MSNLNRHPVRRTAAGVLASALAFSGAFAAATPAHAAAGFTLERIAGVDRYDTSARTAAAFDAAAAVTNVILASGENGRAADALGASFLAGVRGAPVLLTPQASLSATTRAALTALRTGGATSVTIVGGPAAVSAAVQAEVTALGFTVNRLGGVDRFQTAELVVAAGEGATASNVGIVASGISTVDALAVGPLAYKGKHPIFLTRAASIPASTIASMRANGVTSVYIVGGETVVSANVRSQLTAAGITVVDRLAGQTRSGTSVAIANAIIGGTFGFTNTTFNVASGANDGVDALSGAALSGLQNRALLVTDTATSAGAVTAFATARAATLNAPGIIFGGFQALSEAVEVAIETAGGGTTSGGQVTLTNATAAAGSTFTGTLANPATVQSVSVTGCGFTNQAVTIGSAGGFTLPVPGSQAVGACTLTFSVLGTNGITTTQVVPFTVTAPPSSTTAAPDLVSASVNATTGVVTYTFDQDVSGLAVNDARRALIYVYDTSGARTTATEASVSGTTLIARFGAGTAGTDIANAATLAGIGTGAVQDAAGRPAYAASAALGVQTQTAGRTGAPDLESVSGLRVQGGAIVADFRFDEPVLASSVDPSDFALVDSDGTPYFGDDTIAATFSVDRRTVTVAFNGAVENIPQGTIVRGVAAATAVTDDGGAANATQTEPRTGTPDFTAGVLTDRTARPDITSVVVAGVDVIQVTFDEAVNVSNTGNFVVYNSAGTPTAATGTAVRSSSDTRVVNVTFAGTTVASAVGFQALAGAVTDVDSSLPNAVHELGLQNISNTAGRTASPDLVSVRATVDAFSNNTVVFTFDQAVTEAQANALGNFGLIDASGTEFTPTGAAPTRGSSNTTVTFSAAQFSNAQAAAAVVGNYEDPTNGAADPTTGDVPVQR